MTNLSDLLPAGAASKQLSFTASGAISSGQTVALQSDGTVKVVGLTSVSGAVGTTSQFSAGDIASSAIAYDSTNNKILVAYSDSADSSNGKAVVGTVSGTNITFGTPVQFSGPTTGDGNRRIGICFNSTEGKFVIVFRDSSINNYGRAVTATISGTSVSFGSSAVFSGTSVTNYQACSFDSTSNRVVVAYSNDSDGGDGYAVVGTISGTGISFGTPVEFESGYTYFPVAVYDSNADKTVFVYRDGNNSNYGTAVVATVSGTSISYGSPVVFESAQTEHQTAAFDSANNKIVVGYADVGNSGYGTAIVGTVSGTSISFGTPAVFHSVSTGNVQMQAAYNVKAGKTVIGYGGSNVDGTYIEATVSGTSLSFSSPVTFESVGYINQAPAVAAYDSTNFLVLFSFREAQVGTGDAVAIRSAYTSSNSSDFLGIADAAISNAASGNITMKGGVATNSQLLPLAYTGSLGSEVVFDTGLNQFTGMCYDTTNDKIVITYQDSGNSDYGTAVVGTVSGTSISFGTPVVFNAAETTYTSPSFDSASGKVVIAYVNYSTGYGTAIVGTVSGTSISFGTAVTFASATTLYTESGFDSNSNKVVVAYSDSGNSGYGTAIVGTVSGTSISFGTEVVFDSTGTLSAAFGGFVFDSTNNKVVIPYSISGGATYGIVGTVSGTSISFGTRVAIGSVSGQNLSIAFDSNAGKVVINYRDANNSDYTGSVVGTVSGTSISFGTELVIEEVHNLGTTTFDSSDNKIIFFYKSSSPGYYRIGTVSGTSISYGSPVVFNAATVASLASAFDPDQGTAVIAYRDNSQGTAVGLALTGAHPNLVPNTTYYVQDDGTLSTTSSTVTAGKAMSTNSINLDYST